MTLQQIIDDPLRLKFWQDHVENVVLAITVDKVPIKALLAWALLDNFEWLTYDPRFGCIAVDYRNGTLDRHIKNSTYWLSSYFTANATSPYQRSATTATSTTASVSTTGGTDGGSGKKSGAGGVILGSWLFVVVVSLLIGVLVGCILEIV
ncbi:hypothetical protein HDU76_009506 [Blyttiomyces sp. JEL0837]|nr:hypothetical protein HDU76_009506 [Blyttiomyces sp. JEL0837]